MSWLSSSITLSSAAATSWGWVVPRNAPVSPNAPPAGTSSMVSPPSRTVARPE